MAGLLGHIDAYDESSEQWSTYVERFEHFVVANDVPDAKRVAVFLSVIGATTYGLLRSLLAPDKPGSKTYRHLVDTLNSHFSPKPIVIAERFRFHKRNQEEGESVAQYVAVLKKLSEHCDFGAHLQDALRDRLVCGLNNENIQRKLLTEETLTFQRAVDTALSMEAVARESQHLKSSLKGHALSLSPQQEGDKCFRCGKANHSERDCYFKEQQCHSCNKRGHIARVCKSKKSNQKHTKTKQDIKMKQNKYHDTPKGKIHKIEANPSDSEKESTSNSDSNMTLHMLSAVNTETEPVMAVKTENAASSMIIIRPRIEGQLIDMELDTGAAVSLISRELYETKFGHLGLRNTDVVLKTYTGELLQPEGMLKVWVKLNRQKARLPLYVVKGTSPPLFGREWLRNIKLDWREIKTVRTGHKANDSLKNVLNRHAEVFSKELGTLKGFEASLTLKPGQQPKFCQARVVPYALRPKVEAELERLFQQGVISPVQFSDWATPIVPVIKKNGGVRICGDFKVTVNPALRIEHYPIPRIEDLFASLSGGHRFSKLDLSQAYLQVPVNMGSRKYLTITTHKGMFCYNRLPFGITSAPSIFQRIMDQVLQGLPNVHCFLDDILVTGRDDAHHLRNLEAVLSRLEKFGLRVQKEKCEFFRSSLEYLGHIIDSSGLHKSPDKIRAIVDAPMPTDISQLRSFLGLINYYGRFVPNLSMLLHPLNALLHKGVKWEWSMKADEAFREAKEKLSSKSVLTHYNPSFPVILACDASPYGVGAVISHRLPNGEERPIAFASRALSKAEQNYAQIEREALGIIFGVRRFHSYLYGRNFTLLTDHRPLTAILSPNKAIPSMAAARLQRWALLLAAHDYTIKYRRAADHGNADGLSLLPLPAQHEVKQMRVDTFLINHIESFPILCKDVKKETSSDSTLSLVMEMVVTGRFPPAKDSDGSLAPYLTRKDELSVLQGCLMWGNRVIVPPNLRQRVLEELHVGHPGVVKMKAIARSYVWWPGLDAQVEDRCKTCISCRQWQKSPGLTKLHLWPWPTAPWQRIHIDFAGPFEGRTFFVVVDAHSKWPEVILMDSTSSAKTIEVLRGLFSHYGVPEVLVSDNGPQFTSEEFANFLTSNGIKHKRSAPFHPATNGLAERSVQTFKHSLKASKGMASVQKRLDAFLLQYRNTAHATTKETPAMLFLHRRLRTRLDLLKPNVAAVVDQAQEAQQHYRDTHAKARTFSVGDPVLVRNYRQGEEKWTSGRVTSQAGPVSFQVEVGSKQQWNRHADQMMACHPNIVQAAADTTTTASPNILPDTGDGQDTPSPLTVTGSPLPGQSDTTHTGTATPHQTLDRYPRRICKPPDRLNL
ncbi:hypothetical protein ACEWY4_027184 [Coilia grayii]|uniref:Gypsy retrotransposon integrase-like protein 1 n=1 Tax=Coilia grayii TaxID=363190 RepID=A0ABD1ITX2_9TELE